MKWTQRMIIRSFVANHLFLITIALLSGILVSVIQVFIPLSIGTYYELLFGGHSAKGQLLEQLHISPQSLPSFFAYFFILIGARGIAGFIERYSNGLTGEAFLLHLRLLLFKSQLDQEYKSFQGRNPGKHIIKHTSDMRSAQDFLVKGWLGFLGDLVFLVLAIAGLYFIEPSLAVIVVITIPFAFGLNYLLSRRTVPVIMRRNDARASLLDFTSSRLHAFLTIKALNRETPEYERFQKKAKKAYTTGAAVHVSNALVGSLLPVIIYLMIGIVMLRGAQQTRYGLEASSLLVFILMMLYMQRVLKRLLRVPYIVRQGNHALQSFIGTISQSEHQVHSESSTRQSQGKLQITNVQLKAATELLPARSFSMNTTGPGIYSILSDNQEWRSRITRQLIALEAPEAGSISLDETAYETTDPFAIRKKIAIISPQIPLLGDTLFEAISYGRSEERKNAALKTLELYSIPGDLSGSDALQMKLDSATQRLTASQQIVFQFIRAELTRKTIVVIEDPFTGIDLQVSNELISHLSKWRSTRTIILISSYLPQGMHVDQQTVL
jgi:ABC-type multidrug transport system fused ATPase/permease subunit